jgi:hypothetical protein
MIFRLGKIHHESCLDDLTRLDNQSEEIVDTQQVLCVLKCSSAWWPQVKFATVYQPNLTNLLGSSLSWHGNIDRYGVGRTSNGTAWHGWYNTEYTTTAAGFEQHLDRRYSLFLGCFMQGKRKEEGNQGQTHRSRNPSRHFERETLWNLAVAKWSPRYLYLYLPYSTCTTVPTVLSPAEYGVGLYGVQDRYKPSRVRSSQVKYKYKFKASRGTRQGNTAYESKPVAVEQTKRKLVPNGRFSLAA